MHKELLAQSPLLILPLIALGIFLVIFFSVVLRTMTKRPQEIEGAARLPLGEEDTHE